MRQRFCRVCRGWHDLSQPWPSECAAHFGGERGEAPGIISDSMDALRHPITQEMMDSKSRFRAVTKSHGCVEVGNDSWPSRPEIKGDPIGPDIRRAYEQLTDR